MARQPIITPCTISSRPFIFHFRNRRLVTASTMSQQLHWTPPKSFFKATHSSGTPHPLVVNPRSRFTYPLHRSNSYLKSSINPVHRSNSPSPFINSPACLSASSIVRKGEEVQPPSPSSSAMPPPPNLPPLPPATTFFWGETPEEEFYRTQGVRNSKSYFETPNGKLFTQSWLPLDEDQPVKAAVFMTHGYGSDTSWCFQKICIEYAKWGYAVFAADLLGHGRSDGLHGYLGDMDKVAATSLSYFLSVRRSETYCKLPAFLFGESMGGMITMLMYFQSEPDTWTGLIFSAPLFVIPENMIPSKLHLTMYGLLFGFADTWAAMPDNKMVGKAIRDPEKLKVIAANPKRYAGRPRVGTMREVVRVTNYIQNNFHKVTTPFLALHGTADGVTCPTGSQMLYEKALSKDKSLKLYEGMYHSLIQGEPDDAANLVLADMRAWIDEKAEKYGPKSNGN